MLRCCLMLFAAASIFGQQIDPAVGPSAAQRAERAGDFAGAESIYAQLLEHDHDPALYQRLGLVRHMQNKFESAAQAFEEAIKGDPSLWGSHLFLGIDRYRLNQFDAADLSLTTANRLRPNEPEILFWSGATKLARHDFRDGYRLLETILERDPGNTEVLRMLAESYANFGTSLLNNVGEKFPNSPAGLTVQGQAFEFEAAYQPALECYRAALAQDPTRPGLREDIRRVEARLTETGSAPQ